MLNECFADVLKRILDNIPALRLLPRTVKKLITFQFSRILASTCAILSQKQIHSNASEAFWWIWRPLASAVLLTEAALLLNSTKHRRADKIHWKGGSRTEGTVNARGFAWRASNRRRPKATEARPLRPQIENSFVYLNFSINCTALGDVWCWTALERALGKSQSWLFLGRFIFRQKFHLIYHRPDCPPGWIRHFDYTLHESRLAEDDLLRNVIHSFAFFAGWAIREEEETEEFHRRFKAAAIFRRR